jgi:cyclopropane fatty-acyl-phospholipid synthase-like methyltransferase
MNIEHLSIEERKRLHSGDYVKKYERGLPRPRIENVLRQMALNKAATVVDVGCGNGIIIEYISQHVGKYVGVDFSQEFIDVARSRAAKIGADNVSFECALIGDFCKRNQDKFDVAFAFDLSEHVYDEEWAEIVRSIYSCLKPGGHFYLHTPNAGFLVEMLKDKNLILRQFPEHIAVRGIDENKRFLHEAGFSQVHARFIPHYNILRYLHPLSFIPRIGKYFAARIFIDAVK